MSNEEDGWIMANLRALDEKTLKKNNDRRQNYILKGDGMKFEYWRQNT